MMRAIRALVLAGVLPLTATLMPASVLGLPLAATAGDAPAVTKAFEGWTATCNNLRTCVVIGTAQDDIFYVRIARAAGATAPPQVKVVLAAEEPFKGAAPAFLLAVIVGTGPSALAPLQGAYADGDASILSARVAAGEKSLAFIDAIRNGASLQYAVAKTKGSLDLKGLSAALRFIDAQQRRQGTPTALVARGMTPIGQVPPAPPAPTVTAAAAGSVTEVDKPVFSKALTDMAAAVCDADVVADQADASAWRLASGRVLVAVPCSQGAYNLLSALYTTAADGSDPHPIVLPRPAAESDEGQNIAVNTRFDLTTMQLSSLDKGRGLGDCGTAATWVWDGRSFVLLNASGLDACPGALPDDWPSLYTASVK